jgi:putative ABC transport system permease protein
MFSNLRYRLCVLFRRNSMEAELDKELRAHIERQAEKYVQAGMSPENAARRARLEFGGVEQVKEECRDSWGVLLISELGQDLRYGLRQLRRNPGFTNVAVVTLALGIGATTAIFSVAEAVLWKPLPFPESDRLVTLEEHNFKRVESQNVSPPDYMDWHDQNTVFQHLAALKWPDWDNLSGGKMAERVRVSAISANYFKVLGVQPQLGRAFFPRENEEGRNRVAILSHRIWVRQFDANPSVLGKAIKLDGEPYVVVGVNPPGLQLTYIYKVGVFIPLVFDTPKLARRDWVLGVLGRLKKGVTVAQAQSDMDAVARRLETQYPKTNAGRGVIVRLWRTEIGRYYRPELLLFLCAAFFVLLIACVNTANLLLARSTGRRAEFAVRTALGSGRKRLTRQLLTESCLLALIGGSLGILIAVWGVDIFVKLGFDIPRLGDIRLDGRVLAFALAITFLTAVLFGLAPASIASRVEINSELKGTRSESAHFGHARTRNALVVAELALAMVLLTGAGLFMSSLLRAERAPLGFDPHHLVFSYLSLKGPRYADDRRVASLYQQLVEKTGAIPGVQSAVATSHLPLTGGHSSYFEPRASPNPARGDHPWALISVVTPGYLRTMRIPLLRGRYFTERDDAASPKVAIISERLAQRYFPGDNPLGRQITILSGLEPGEIKPQVDQVVGVAANIKEVGVGEVPFVTIYLPFAQNPMRNMYVVARAPTSAESVTAALRREISSVDKDLPVYDVKTMEQFMSENRTGDRLNMILIQTFAALALILAAVGIFGVISYSVGQRTREIGIRLALGARPGNVLSLVLRQSAALVAMGLTLGVIASLGLGRLLHNVLYMVPYKSNGLIYGVSTHDPVTLSSAAIILAAVAILASYIPARRAAKVDPMMALRYE